MPIAVATLTSDRRTNLCGMAQGKKRLEWGSEREQFMTGLVNRERVGMEVGPVIDCHQHLWPAALVEELRRRRRCPRMEGWALHLDGEPTYRVQPADHDVARRRRLDVADGVDLALVSLSSPLGVESMAPDEAVPLLNAWHAFADEIEERHLRGYGMWAAVSLVEPDLEGLAATLRRPHIHGLQVPATAMPHPAAVAALAPVLAVVEKADLPLLVHPGPASAAPNTDLPGWWPALTSYTAQLNAAWFAWHTVGRSLFPRLRIAFVALAGLAPLHHERLEQRGGDFGTVDRFLFYETSSYGMRAIEAMTSLVGVDQLVHGSDRPYAVPMDPGLGPDFSQALFATNPAHLMYGRTR